VGLEYSIVVVMRFSRGNVDLSGGGLVLVRKSAEDLFSADPVLGKG
jgi:hypothetical protein